MGVGAISGADCAAMARHKGGGAHAYTNMPPDDRAAYQRVHAELTRIGHAFAGDRFKVTTTKSFYPQVGIRGYVPKDLWVVLSPRDSHDDLGMPQIYLIVSERGAEVGFAASIHPSDFTDPRFKERLRAEVPVVFDTLPMPDDPRVLELDADLQKDGGWVCRLKTRLAPDAPADFEGPSAMLAFLKEPKGKAHGAGSIVRYIRPDAFDTTDLEEEFSRAVQRFSFLLDGQPATPIQMQAAAPAVRTTHGLDDLAASTTEEAFTLDDALDGSFLERAEFERLLKLLQTKKNLILQGPPGVGKTFIARRLAYALMGAVAPDRVTVVQFHQSYTYEDFVQGYRPGPQGFVRRDGVFHRFCQHAASDPGHSYVFIVDEINRGNVSKIFGELLMLIEADKRSAKWAVPLAYHSHGDNGEPADKPFFVPDNVHLLGMMNTADRSLAVVDYALRRRFAFADLAPQFVSPAFRTQLLEAGGASDALTNRIITRMAALNDLIANAPDLGPGFRVGHSFFCPQPGHSANEEWYARVVNAEIEPLLREYWFDARDMAERAIAELLAP